MSKYLLQKIILNIMAQNRTRLRPHLTKKRKLDLSSIGVQNVEKSNLFLRFHRHFGNMPAPKQKPFSNLLFVRNNCRQIPHAVVELRN